jgi:hypothetical protein
VTAGDFKKLNIGGPVTLAKMAMNLESFASKHRLKMRRNADDDNEPCVTGKNGQIYEYSEVKLAVSFAPGLDKNHRGIGRWTPKAWGNLRRKAVALGMSIRQNGDSEGAISFDPENRDQAKLAIKIARARQKKQLSPDRLLAMLANLAKAREMRLWA